MESTFFLAQFIGIFSIIFALSMILRKKMVVQIIHEMFQNRALVYVLGVFELAAGLLMVLYHNVWADTLSSFVSIMGWLLIIESAFYLFAPKNFLRRVMSAIHSTKVYYLFTFLYLVVGIILAFIGFSA